MRQPQVSIILINYNNFQITCNCIVSIIKSVKHVSYEIILVDNASVECDATVFTEKFPEVKLIKSKKNLGFSKGNNLGIRAAEAETILLLNNDTVLLNDAVSIAFEKLQDNPKVGVVGGQLQYPNGDIQHNAGKFPSIWLVLLDLFRISKLFSKAKRTKLFLGFYFDHKSEVTVDWLWGAFFMIKRKVIDKLPDKKLPDELFMYGEDIEWGYAIKKAGFKMIFCPDAKVVHYVGQSNFGKIQKTIRRNLKYVLKKYRGSLFSTFYMLLSWVYDISLGLERRLIRK